MRKFQANESGRLYSLALILRSSTIAESKTTMAPEGSIKSAQASKEALDVISNRISIALAKHEKIVKSWTALSSRPKEPEKTQEELEAEDAALFRKAPQYLGVGAAIPSHFLVSDAERNNKSLRAKFFPTKGLKGSKPRDEEEKVASAKRAKFEESSDEEAGRSALGKAKKRKRISDPPAKKTGQEEKSSVQRGSVPATQPDGNSNAPKETVSKELEDSKVPISQHPAPVIAGRQSSKSAEELREEKRQKKLLKKKQKKKNKNKNKRTKEAA